jgi:hypothetical protein
MSGNLPEDTIICVTAETVIMPPVKKERGQMGEGVRDE